MKKLLVAAAALLLAGLSLALPAGPASAAGTTFAFSALAQSQHLAFDPTVDVLHFDSAGIPAASVRITDVVGNLAVSAAGKTIYLDGTELRQLTVANVTFADDSMLLVGDNSLGTRKDDERNVWTTALSTKANQFMGLVGGDDLTGGGGPDRFVGGDAKPALEHISRVGATGSPTASTNPSVSADGNLVAFEGGWTQFGSTNDNATDVLVKHVDSGSVTDEHRTTGGSNGLSGSGAAQLSADGRYVVFESSSDLLGASAPSATIYRADTATNAVVAVSTVTGGAAFANGFSHEPDVSADGRYVVFTSAATNLASGSTGTTFDVFRKDLQTGSVQRVSTSATLTDANADCAHPRISADGRYVVFSTAATNLSSQNTGGGATDIFVFDASTDELYTLTGDQTGTGSSRNPDVAFDASDSSGAFVFDTDKALVAADTNNQTDVYAYQFGGGFSRVSTTTAGAQVGLASQEPTISADGRFVAFRTYSDSLAAGDTDGYPDVVVKDRSSGKVALISTPTSGASNQGSGAPEISIGGDWVVFESGASNLASTDGNGTGNDVFRVANPLAVDTLRGKGGNDTYVESSGSGDQLVEVAGEGTDTVETSGTYVLTAPNVENIVSPPGINGHDDFTGNSGNNRIDPGLGSDRLRGSLGNDTYVTDVATDVISDEPSTNGGTDTVEAGVAWTLQSFLENLTLTGSSSINGGGNSSDNVITGNAGINTLSGYAGNDTLIEVGGNDTLNGSSGNDTYVFTHATGSITGESGSTLGTDTVKSSVTWTLGAYLENLTLTGNSTINGTGNTANNVLVGNSAANVLSGGAGADSYTGGGGADQFTIDTSATVDTVNDFTVGTDKFRMRQSAWQIGDGDLLVEGATNRTGPGGFSKSAEYVVISKNLTSITTANAAAAIGSATSTYATGNRRIFVVDNGTSSQAMLFISSGNDAKVTAAELKPLMTFKNRNAMSVTSLAFTA